MKDSVYLYFGAHLLTNGSYDDLERLGITPQEELALKFYEPDFDDESRPVYLCAEGTLYLEGSCWYARVNGDSFHSVLRSDVDG